MWPRTCGQYTRRVSPSGGVAEFAASGAAGIPEGISVTKPLELLNSDGSEQGTKRRVALGGSGSSSNSNTIVARASIGPRHTVIG